MNFATKQITRFVARVEWLYKLSSSDMRSINAICQARYQFALAAENYLLEFLTITTGATLLMVLGVLIYGRQVDTTALLKVVIAFVAAYVTVFWAFVSYTRQMCNPVKVANAHRRMQRASMARAS